MRISEVKRKQKKKDRQHKQNIGRRIVLGAVVIMLAATAFKSIDLHQKKAENEAKKQELQTELAAEEARSKEIDAYQEYVGTDEYIEQVAKDRLGLAYPNEKLLRPED